jgi:hypothetical protein
MLQIPREVFMKKIVLLVSLVSVFALGAKPPVVIKTAKGVAMDGLFDRPEIEISIGEIGNCDHQLTASLSIYTCPVTGASVSVKKEERVLTLAADKLRVLYYQDGTLHEYMLSGEYVEQTSTGIALASTFNLQLHRGQKEMKKMRGILSVPKYSLEMGFQAVPTEEY